MAPRKSTRRRDRNGEVRRFEQDPLKWLSDYFHSGEKNRELVESVLKVPVTDSMANDVRTRIRDLVSGDMRSFYPDVIISYPTRHRECDAHRAGPGSMIAASVVQLLFDHDFPCYSDMMTQPGSNWETYMPRLERAKVMVVLVDPELFLSVHCLREVSCAIRRGIEIIPVRCSEPNKGGVDFARNEDDMWPDQDIESYAGNNLSLLEDLRTQRVIVRPRLCGVDSIPGYGTLLSEPTAAYDIVRQVRERLLQASNPTSRIDSPQEPPHRDRPPLSPDPPRVGEAVVPPVNAPLGFSIWTWTVSILLVVIVVAVSYLLSRCPPTHSQAPPTGTQPPVKSHAPPSPLPTIPPVRPPVPPETPEGRWLQQGPTLNGTAENDSLGQSSAMSNDGRVFALGATQSSSKPGYVLVCRLDEEKQTWTSMNCDEIVEDDMGDNFDVSVSLSGDGTILAVGADKGGGKGAGRVRVFKYDTSAKRWRLLGKKIGGLAYGDRFGSCVYLSEKGDTLAVGAPESDDQRGSVHVFQYNNDTTTWETLGKPLIGAAAGDKFGSSVSMNDSGTAVGVGAPWSGENKTGQVFVFQYDDSSKEWSSIGELSDQLQNGLFGWCVSLDGSGKVVAVGAPGTRRVRVFENDGGKTWKQRGNVITHKDPTDFGWSVSLSNDGTTLAVGIPRRNSTGIHAGQVRIYQYKENEWTHDEEDHNINGESSHDLFGFSVFLAGNGMVVVVGGPSDSASGVSKPGYAKVFALKCSSTVVL